MVGMFHIWKVKIFVMILFSGVTEYSDRKVIILPRYSIPRLPLSNAVVVCYGRVHCRIQSWIPGSVLFRLTARGVLTSGMASARAPTASTFPPTDSSPGRPSRARSCFSQQAKRDSRRLICRTTSTLHRASFRCTPTSTSHRASFRRTLHKQGTRSYARYGKTI